jgi:hypothetical protein
MPAILYGTGAYRRLSGNLPELRLVNLFVESSPAGQQGAVLLSRPGLLASARVGIGPVTGVYCQDGVFDGDLFVLSGGHLYRAGADLGEVPGNGPVSFAGRAGEVLVTAGTGLYSYDGASLAAVTLPDDFDATAVVFHDGLFIAARAGSHKFYWSAVNDGRSWDALDFASAESAPDNLLDLRILNDTLWLFGAETIEPWGNTGNPDAPYERFEQRIFSKGVIGTGCTVEMDNSLLFVGNDGICYRIADVPQRISDHGIEERIQASGTVAAFGFVHEGHSFFCVRLDDGTFAFDVATGQWCEFASHGRDNFRGQCAVSSGTDVYIGDDESGTLWTLSGSEDACGPFERLFTAAFPITGRTVAVDNLNVEANVGWTHLLSGQGSEPTIEMRSSRDKGATWTGWRGASLGRQGAYGTDVQWRRNGIFARPGAMFEFRVTDPVDFSVSAVSVNEPGGGRAR